MAACAAPRHADEIFNGIFRLAGLAAISSWDFP
jgi:hypothetical protein